MPHRYKRGRTTFGCYGCSITCMWEAIAFMMAFFTAHTVMLPRAQEQGDTYGGTV